LEEDGLIITHRTSGRSVTEDASIIKKAKTELAQEQVSTFLEKMRLMGFEQKETVEIINGIVGGIKI